MVFCGMLWYSLVCYGMVMYIMVWYRLAAWLVWWYTHVGEVCCGMLCGVVWIMGIWYRYETLDFKFNGERFENVFHVF